MNKPHLALAILVIVAALGAAGIVPSISSATEAQADSCNREIALCHGYADDSRGAFVSKGKCFHS
jgi:hypothetical protein